MGTKRLNVRVCICFTHTEMAKVHVDRKIHRNVVILLALPLLVRTFVRSFVRFVRFVRLFVSSTIRCVSYFLRRLKFSVTSRLLIHGQFEVVKIFEELDGQCDVTNRLKLSIISC